MGADAGIRYQAILYVPAKYHEHTISDHFHNGWKNSGNQI